MLERLGMIGVSWRNGSGDALTRFTLASEQRAARLAAFADAHGLTDLVYIGTCNRVELGFRGAPGAPRRDLRAAAYELLTGHPAAAGVAARELRAWSGEGAAEHLFMVTCALDSACLGEAEVAGQVRAAHAAARENALCGPPLDALFEAAYRVAAQVRSTTGIANGRVSLAAIAADQLIAHQARHGGRVALVGVSPMTERAAESLAARKVPMLVVNRTRAHARTLAGRHGAEAMALADFARDGARAVCALLSATGAPGSVLERAALERLQAHAPDGCQLLVIDMAVPADIAATDCAALDLPRIDMNAITAIAADNRGAREREAARARELVDAALGEFTGTLAERRYGPLAGRLQQRYQQTADSGVERLLERDLANLGTAEQEAVRRWARVLARRFAHIPCVGLRGLLRD
ncbi:MAG: hypothetical protein RLW62_08425, partial [Gammaproteobacteria bacterium]